MKGEMHFDVKSFKADCVALSAQERGAYLYLLFEMHLSEDGWIDDDNEQLRKLTGVASAHWRAVRKSLSRFLIERGGRLSQKRILRDKSSSTSKVNQQGKPAEEASSHIESKPNPLRLPLDSKTNLESEPRAKRTRSRSVLSEDAMPGIEHLAEAKKQGFDQGRCISMWHAFKDYHRARGNRMADWLAAWRTWVRNEAKYHPYGYRPNGGSNGKRSSVVEAFDGILQRATADSEDSESGQGSLLSLPPGSVR